MAHYKLDKNIRVIYGAKENGDFITDLLGNYKYSDFYRGDFTFVDRWINVDTKEYMYRIGKKLYTCGDYARVLYDLFKMKDNYKYDCYYRYGDGDYHYIVM